MNAIFMSGALCYSFKHVTSQGHKCSIGQQYFILLRKYYTKGAMYTHTLCLQVGGVKFHSYIG